MVETPPGPGDAEDADMARLAAWDAEVEAASWSCTLTGGSSAGPPGELCRRTLLVLMVTLRMLPPLRPTVRQLRPRSSVDRASVS